MPMPWVPKRIDRPVPLSVGRSPICSDQPRRTGGRLACRTGRSHHHCDANGVVKSKWSISCNGICLTLSLRLKIRHPKRPAPTQTTAFPHVPLKTFADLRAQMDSRLPRSTTRLRAHATHLRSSVTVSAWLRGCAPQTFLSARRGVWLAIAPRWDLDGQPVVFLAELPVRGSASTLSMILKVVSACSVPCFRISIFRNQIDLFVPQTGGGCMYPLTAYSPIGKDCSTIPGVADVSCLGGECVVQRCLPGYLLGLDGTSCIRKHSISQSQFSNPEDVPARVYGLEHVPFGGN